MNNSAKFKSICSVFGLTMLMALFFSACSTKVETPMKGSSGSTLEVLFVADKTLYSGQTKALVDSLFAAPQYGLPQAEPIFDLVNIPVSSFKNTEMFRVHRNVILCEINPDNPNKVYCYKDRWSSPQIVFEFAAKDKESLHELLRKYEKKVIEDIYATEYRRMNKAFKASENVDIRNSLRDKFGFTLTVSEEFTLANPNNPSDDFMWIRKETKDFGIGVLVQVVPYTSKSQFEQAVILDALDTMMRHHVPCASEDSYMGTERRIDAVSRIVDFEGSYYCVETRGLWRAFGNFMGGPYVCYTLLSPDNTLLVTLTGYVYYPSGRLKSVSKRDLLMQVDGICRSLSFSKE